MESSNMIDLLQQHEEPFFFLHDPLLNGNELIPSISSVQQHIVDPASFITSSHYMVQDLGFQWSGHGQRSSQQTQLAKIKEELSLEEQTQLHGYDSYLHAPLIHGKLGFDPLSLGMLLPSLNIPNAYFPSMDASTAMDMEALEMLESARFGRIGPCESFDVNSSTVFDNINYGVVHPLLGRAQGGFMNLQEIPTSVSGLTEGKRANCSSLDHLKTSKKPRFDSRSSLPPFKVRKEKLGDRIAALQQLVAPFGKTDTASVLMEAIGYIKFLQDQVETLSVPYMRTSKNKKLSTTEEVSIATQRENPKPDLRSRGLCLVPLSCTSYVTNDNAVWSPPNFR